MRTRSVRNSSGRRGVPLRVMLVAVLVLLFCGFRTTHAAMNGISDNYISYAIEVDLILDPSVSSHLIDVETKEGIVTLSGTVDHLLAKARAVAIACATRGVRSVVDQLKVKPVKRTDEEVQRDAKWALASDPAVEHYKVEVNVKNGIVTLKGTVDSHQEKGLSEWVVKGVRGVRAIDNQIKVKEVTNRPAEEIAAEVKRRLEIDVLVDDAYIDVDAEDGRAILSGTVGSAAEKIRARADAWVDGVKLVDDIDLRVATWAHDRMRRNPRTLDLSDDQIKKAVYDALLYDPRVIGFNPKIEVEDSVVILSGTVTNLRAKRAAGDTALNTIGVRRVRNFLRVRPEKPSKDELIAKRAAEAIERDPYLDRCDITVAVFNGKVFLYGTVESGFDKAWAEDVVAKVNGVSDIYNSLKITSERVRKEDSEIREDVESQIWWNPVLDHKRITVVVEGGAVALNGTVDPPHQRREAARSAWDGGARGVINRLEVREE